MARTEDKEQTFRILELLAEHFYPTKIAKRLKVSRQAISKKLSKMEAQGLIKKIPGTPKYDSKGYEIEPMGKVRMLEFSGKRNHSSAYMKKSRINLTASPFTEDKIEVHHYTIKIPIVEHGKLAHTKKVPLNNWIKEVLHEEFPIPLTISITPKNAILQFHKTELPRNLRFESALFEWSLQGIIYAQAYLTRHGYRLHTIKAKVISQHLAARANERVANEIPKENVFTVKFARKAASLSGSMPKNAEAWTDGSPDPRAIESNDLLYEEKMLLMPEKIDRMERVLVPLLEGFSRYNENIEKHLSVLDKMDKSLGELTEAAKRIRRR